MELPRLPRYISQNSKKRVFPGGSSSYVDADVVEISPSSFTRSSKSKSRKQKEAISAEAIDVDMDEDVGDVMLIDVNNKGKEAMANFSASPISAADVGLMNVVHSSKNYALGSHTLVSVDGFSSNLSYEDDKYMDVCHDSLEHDDLYTILQSHFDNIDIPSGVEAPVPWMSEPSRTKENPTAASRSAPSCSPIQLPAGTDSGTELSPSLWFLEPGQTRRNSSSMHSSTTQTQFHAVSRTPKMDTYSPWLVGGQQNKKSTACCNKKYLSLDPQRAVVNLPSGVESFKSRHVSEFSHCKRKATSSCRTPYHGHANQLPPISGSYFSNSTKKQVGGNLTYSSSHMPMDGIDLLSSVDASDCQDSSGIMKSDSNTSSSVYPGFINLLDTGHVIPEQGVYVPRVQHHSKNQESGTAKAGCSSIPPGSSSSREKENGNEDEIMKKFHLFKKFDTVQDYSDHHYLHSGSSAKQPSKNWVRRVQEEWKILEKDLPDTIFVRVYESRIDLLRAVIVGAEGTPYHDGLFFFDVFFPSSYPNVPPQVYYHSGGLRINPNLYNTGKVCLSLLNTWGGTQKEQWIPGTSTMLQVLVSIQGLILNAKPYFNEPGYEYMSGSANGEKNSLQYNENTFILSLKTMVYTMKKPPKYFEDFVVGHFCKQSHDVLVACKAYMDGAQVGCLVKGGIQDVDEGDKSCSQIFKQKLAGYINTLVTTFTRIGAKDCKEFRSLAQMGTDQHLLCLRS